MTACGACIAVERDWDPQYLRDPGKLCEPHQRALDRLTSAISYVRVDSIPDLIMTDSVVDDADSSP